MNYLHSIKTNIEPKSPFYTSRDTLPHYLSLSMSLSFGDLVLPLTSLSDNKTSRGSNKTNVQVLGNDRTFLHFYPWEPPRAHARDDRRDVPRLSVCVRAAPGSPRPRTRGEGCLSDSQGLRPNSAVIAGPPTREEPPPVGDDKWDLRMEFCSVTIRVCVSFVQKRLPFSFLIPFT